MNLEVLIPTYGRPTKIQPLVENILDTANVPIVFVIEHLDHASQTIALEAGAYVIVIATSGYPSAVNAGFRSSGAEWVLIAGDDTVFHPGWLEALAEYDREPFCVLGPADGTPATEDGNHATMPVVRRSYIEERGGAMDEPGVVFHEGYHHNFSETELCGLAQSRGVWAHVPGAMVEHLHPAWGTAEVDETYERGGLANFDQDAELYEKRAQAWS